ncbi:glycoside hydrolase family 25 protein [Streptomyces sp. NPDC049577]|uniref:glycoside hydrolase family 25 protein n=1 Tax=Streptomyces sp. NPDC049577 TaxID=3155153 RepID=UPI00342D0C0D
MGIYGEDWASYQSAQPDTTGLDFAFVKITEGLGYVNPKWTSQRDHAKAAGLVWGGYHYPHMANDPKDEADYFLSQVNWATGDLIVLDWEGYDPANQNVPRADQAAYKESWLRYVKQQLPHNPVGMYANLDYWRNVDITSFYGDFLWIATAGLPAGRPGIQADWLFHQYSDDGVDRDYCRLGSRAELRTWALSFQPPLPTPAPQEDDVPHTLGEYNNKATSLPVDTWTTLTIGRTDLIPAAQSYTATVYLTVTSPPGATLQGRFYHHRPDGSRWDGPLIERITTVGKSYVDFPHSGSISPGESVRFEVTYGPATTDTTPATITSAAARGLYWK